MRSSASPSPRDLLRALPPRWGLVGGLVITCVVGFATIRMPEFGDGQAYMIPNALIMSRSFSPFIEDEVHPPFFFMLEGLAFRLLGARVEVLHGLCVAFSLAMVWAVYALGKGLASVRTGSLAAFLTATWAPFVVQTSLVRLDIPVAALSVLTLLAAHRGWATRYAVLGSMAALTKAPGVLPPATLAAVATVGIWRPPFRRGLLWIPVAVFGAWLVACKVRFGWFLYPENVQDFSLSRDPTRALGGIGYWVRRLSFDQGAFLPLALGFLLQRRWRWILLALVGLGVAGTRALPGVGWAEGAALGLCAAMASRLWARGGFWRVLPLFALSLVLLFCTYYYRFPRYMLPAWPALALGCGEVLGRKRVGWTVAVVTGGLMVAAAFTERVWPLDTWSTHESTFRHLPFIRARKHAASWLQEHSAGRPILASGKAAEDLAVPALGYVTRPLAVVGPEAGCRAIGSCAYYYELSTMSGHLEKRVRQWLRTCRIRLVSIHVRHWRSLTGEGATAVFGLERKEAGE